MRRRATRPRVYREHAPPRESSRHRNRSRRQSQQPLGAGENILQEAISAYGKTQRACKSFENRLDFMMRRAAVKTAQVDVGFGRLRKALKKILEKFNGEIADLLRF